MKIVKVTMPGHEAEYYVNLDHLIHAHSWFGKDGYTWKPTGEEDKDEDQLVLTFDVDSGGMADTLRFSGEQARTMQAALDKVLGASDA